MEYLVYIVCPEATEPELVGWCQEECELALFIEELEDQGHEVKVVIN